jgi:hypothetical protein
MRANEDRDQRKAWLQLFSLKKIAYKIQNI